MSHKGILSSAFNMSLGYIPVIISIVLCEFITQDTAIYIGTGIGLLYSYYSMHRKGVRIPNFILYNLHSHPGITNHSSINPG